MSVAAGRITCRPAAEALVYGESYAEAAIQVAFIYSAICARKATTSTLSASLPLF